MNAKTTEIINGWEKEGMDPALIVALRKDIESKPTLDNNIANNLLARAEFSRLTKDLNDERELLVSDMEELGRLRAILPSLHQEAEMKTAAEAEILRLTEKLKARPEFDPTDSGVIDNMTLEQATKLRKDFEDYKKGITPATEIEPPAIAAKEGELSMDEATLTARLKTLQAETVYAGLELNNQKLVALKEFETLVGRSATPAESLEFFAKADKELRTGKSIATVATEHFKLDDLRTTNSAAAQTARDEKLKADTRAELMKEFKLSPPDARRDARESQSSVVSRLSERKAKIAADAGAKTPAELLVSREGNAGVNGRLNRITRAIDKSYEVNVNANE